MSLTIKVRIFIHVEDEKVTALNRTHFFLAMYLLSNYHDESLSVTNIPPLDDL